MPQSISKSLLNEVGILENLATQENLVSNSLGNKVGIFRDLAFLPSMRAYLRSRILLRIGASGAGPRLPTRSRKLPRLWSRFFPVAATVILIAKAASSPADPDACRSQVRSSSSLILFPDQFLDLATSSSIFLLDRCS